MTDNTDALPPLPDPDGWAVGECYYPNQPRAKISMGDIRFGASARRYTAEHLRAALAVQQGAQVPQGERAWLVEWRFNGVQWLYLTGGSFNFTSDPNRALRFARRKDAEAAMAWAREFDRRRGLRETGETAVTEHEWTSTMLSASPQAPAQREPSDRWYGAEEWMPLAWELCADECGEEACNELVWEGGPVPEPWGERWLKYEDEAKRLIALVRKHLPAAAPAAQAEQEPVVRDCRNCALEFVDSHRCDTCHKQNGYKNWTARGITKEHP